MKPVLKFLLNIILAYFVGAVFFIFMRVVTEWTFNLPIWGTCVVFVIFGYVIIAIYKKLPRPKEE